MYQNTFSAVENSLLDIVNQIKEKCIENDCEACNQFKLSPAEYDFFKSVSNLSRLDTSIIASKMRLSQSRLSRVIDKLVNDGYLDRKTNQKDRRAIKISLTPKGRKMRKNIEDYKSDCERRIEENLSPEEIGDIQHNLLKLINHL